MRTGLTLRRWLLTGALAGVISLSGGVWDLGQKIAGRPQCSAEAMSLLARAERHLARGELRKAGHATRDALALYPGCAEAFEARAYWALMTMMRSRITVLERDRTREICIDSVVTARNLGRRSARLDMTRSTCLEDEG